MKVFPLESFAVYGIGLICNSMVCCSILELIALIMQAGNNNSARLRHKFPACITRAINSKYYSNPILLHILITQHYLEALHWLIKRALNTIWW